MYEKITGVHIAPGLYAPRGAYSFFLLIMTNYIEKITI